MEPVLSTVEEAGISYPSISDRVQSTFIDSVLIIALMFAFSALLDKVANPPEYIRIVLFFSLFGIYEPVCVTLGCTLGNYMKGIRVRQVDNHKKRINFFQAFIRYLIKILLGWLSFLSVHMNRERRALHDLAAGSVVVFA